MEIRLTIQQDPSSLVPFDGTESAIPEQYIHEAGGAHHLIPILDVRIAGIALCDVVSKRDAMAVPHLPRKRGRSHGTPN